MDAFQTSPERYHPGRQDANRRYLLRLCKTLTVVSNRASVIRDRLPVPIVSEGCIGTNYSLGLQQELVTEGYASATASWLREMLTLQLAVRQRSLATFQSPIARAVFSVALWAQPPIPILNVRRGDILHLRKQRWRLTSSLRLGLRGGVPVGNLRR